ncbi:PcfJ domain-containing protein [Flavobacterium sp.]|uniref:PcfJ domain-containing protein n=1 Tax=Flavobacterium sp. TaxID=239 RepID=UPI004034A6A9
MAHAFRNTPKHFTIVQAIRRAQAIGCHATPARAEAVAWAHELERFQNPVFALAVIRFVSKVEQHIAFDELQRVLEYLNAMYVADNAYDLKGRTWVSIAKRAAEYHAELAKRRAAEQFSDWELCTVKDYEVEKESGIFRMMQLGTSQALYDEGAEQSHCVADYAYDCTIGSVAIFSLRKYIPGEEGCDILATIEVAIETMAIVQAKAKFNDEPSEEAFAVIMEWAKAEGLANRICYEEYDDPVQPVEPLQYQEGHLVPGRAAAPPPPLHEEPVYYNRQHYTSSSDDDSWK